MHVLASSTRMVVMFKGRGADLGPVGRFLISVGHIEERPLGTIQDSVFEAVM
jgi:hypothetical protein